MTITVMPVHVNVLVCAQEDGERSQRAVSPALRMDGSRPMQA